MKLSMPALRMTGAISGRVTVSAVRTAPAPDARADSSSEASMLRSALTTSRKMNDVEPSDITQIMPPRL